MNLQDNSHLAQHEDRLLQYLDGQLPAAEARALEVHLAVCPECQALRRQWAQLEATLVRTLAPPRLSADFTARLRRRVLAESDTSTTAVSLRESEIPAAPSHPVWNKGRPYRSDPLWFRLLDGLGWGVFAAIGGYYLFRLTLTWLPASAITGTTFLRSPAFILALATAAAALLFGGNFAAKSRVRRWLSEF